MHLALYRKFRPVSFDGIIGQDHIITSLKNQVKNNEISHAYLFMGSRGTGKTSCAKILAKAINCLSPIDGSPCGHCEVCRALDSSNNTDILEIDAASNNRVDEIRELRERVKYAPIVGSKKVYIIDEVHMLTDSAFNALLKTLEEPPKNVVFILATTEIHKLPATILSRVMKFDFKLVSVEQLSAHLRTVLDSINVDYDDDSISLIARAGEGSVRDTLSIADAVLSYTDNHITYDKTLEVVGKSDMALLLPLIESILLNNPAKIITDITDITKSGKSVSVLHKDICNAIKDLIVYKSNLGDSLSPYREFCNDMAEIFSTVDVNRLSYIFVSIAKIEMDLKYSLDPMMMLCSACVKGGMPEYSGTPLSRSVVDNTKSTNNNDQDVLWGYVIRDVRESGMFALSTAIKNINTISIDKSTIILHCGEKTNIDLFNDEQRSQKLTEIIKKYFTGIDKYMVKYDIAEIPIDDIINNLKDMFGYIKVK